ncbi:MAG TPA: tRNA uridine-5-carboxymethylaminomethyl(34) synthesis GTPase MnmE [Candidatus Aphodomonas merdavium]|nr:tRNA uridine-5-carboxymethylaminomethyl(34) synthesis GTPase MnmE [Candidatus Aphodomonas merdavium]
MYKEERTNDTIAAVATPPGTGGVAIVRVSGPEAEAVLNRSFRRGGGASGPWESHRLSFGKILRGQEIVDEGMAVLMRAPKSYTREDVAELYCHGGTAVTRMVLEAVLLAGARPAAPGEFTRRAFENGRIDLAQAEAVMRLVGAQGEAQARAARRQLEGAVSHGIVEVRQKLTEMLSQIAACTDFPDEIDEAPAAANLIAQGRALCAQLRAACDPSRARVLETGLDVVLVGRPNVGKSSLLNALLGEERAIVTADAGTTRDAVRGTLEIAGVRVNLTDTAGIRQTGSEAERIGVQRAKEAAERADLVLAVLDASRPLEADDEEILRQARQVRCVVVLNKCDLPRAQGMPQGMAVSARTGEGTDALRALLEETARSAQSGSALLTQARHIDAAQRAAGALEEMVAAIEKGVPLDFAAVDATAALRALGEITGEDAEQSVIDAVFAHFCVGK